MNNNKKDLFLLIRIHTIIRTKKISGRYLILIYFKGLTNIRQLVCLKDEEILLAICSESKYLRCKSRLRIKKENASCTT